MSGRGTKGGPYLFGRGQREKEGLYPCRASLPPRKKRSRSSPKREVRDHASEKILGCKKKTGPDEEKKEIRRKLGFLNIGKGRNFFTSQTKFLETTKKGATTVVEERKNGLRSVRWRGGPGAPPWRRGALS